jgi:hypothetical protein
VVCFLTAPAGYNPAVDIKVARTTVDDFILKWPIQWTDGAITRDTPGGAMRELSIFLPCCLVPSLSWEINPSFLCEEKTQQNSP